MGWSRSLPPRFSHPALRAQTSLLVLWPPAASPILWHVCSAGLVYLCCSSVPPHTSPKGQGLQQVKAAEDRGRALRVSQRLAGRTCSLDRRDPSPHPVTGGTWLWSSQMIPDLTHCSPWLRVCWLASCRGFQGGPSRIPKQPGPSPHCRGSPSFQPH